MCWFKWRIEYRLCEIANSVVGLHQQPPHICATIIALHLANVKKSDKETKNKSFKWHYFTWHFPSFHACISLFKSFSVVQLIRSFVFSPSFISSLRFFFRVVFVFLYFLCLLGIVLSFHRAINPGVNAKKNYIAKWHKSATMQLCQ